MREGTGMGGVGSPTAAVAIQETSGAYRHNALDSSGGNVRDSATSLGLDLNSPRSVEALTRYVADYLKDTSVREHPLDPSRNCHNGRKRARAKAGGRRDHGATAYICTERNAINRHRLLREVQREREKLVRERLQTHENMEKGNPSPSLHSTSLSAPVTPRTPQARYGGHNGSGHGADNTASIKGAAAKHATVAGSCRALDDEAHRLVTLKRRQAAELQHMLTFQLRNLAREERDRLRAQKSIAREQAAERMRAERQRAAEQARLDRQHFALSRERELEREAAHKMLVQEEAVRRLEAEDQLRQRQADWAAQQRAEEIKRKADILDSRIKRGIRVRRARELRNEREAAKRADEREAAVEAAKRIREAEVEARKATGIAKNAAARIAVDEARRRRDEDVQLLRISIQERFAELDARADTFRRRRKEITNRERVLHEEQAAELAQQRHQAAQRKMEDAARQRDEELQDKAMRERQMALSLKIRRKEEAAKRQEHKRERECQMKKAVDKRNQAEQRRQDATRQKLEEEALKVELLRQEKDRLKSARAAMCREAAKQRESLKEHFGALRGQLNGCMSFDTIAEAVAVAAQRTDKESRSSCEVGKQNSKIRPRFSNTVETPWAGAGRSASGDTFPELSNTADDVSSSDKIRSMGTGKQHHVSREEDTEQMENAVASTVGDGAGASSVLNAPRVPHPPSMSSPSSRISLSANDGNNTGAYEKSRLIRATTASASPDDLGAHPGVSNEGGLHGDDDDRDTDGCHSSIGVRKKVQHRDAKKTGVDKKLSDAIADLWQRYGCVSGGLGSGSGSVSHDFARPVVTRNKRGGADSAGGGGGGGGTRKSKRDSSPRCIQNQSTGGALSTKSSCSSCGGQSPRRSARSDKGDANLSGRAPTENDRRKIGRRAVKQSEGTPQRQSEHRRRPRLDAGEMTDNGLRSRYDRELLEALEVEQAAESAREIELAKAKDAALLADTRYRNAAATLRTKTSGGNLSRGCILGSAPRLECGDGGGSQDLDGITGERRTAGLPEEPLDSEKTLMTNEGWDDRRRGSSRTPASTGKMGVPTLKIEVNQEMIAAMRREAEATARDMEGLEERLARERLAASKRVMKVSEAYENALRDLAASQQSAESARVVETVS